MRPSRFRAASRGVGPLGLIFLLVLATPAVRAEIVLDIEPPTLLVDADGPLASYVSVDAINQAVAAAIDAYEPDVLALLEPYGDQTDLAHGFANAGAAASHVGTLRSFSDYRRLAVVITPGGAVAVPGRDLGASERWIEDVEADGDIFFGAAVKPLVLSAGIHLAPLSEGTYINVRFGRSVIPDGMVADGLSLSSYSLGAIFSQRVVAPREFPIAWLRWRGVSIGTGALYQSVRADFHLDLDRIETNLDDTDQVVSFADAGFETEAELDAVYPVSDVDLSDPIVVFGVTPSIDAQVVSSTVTVPLEATTGIRILWILDLNVGAGIDLAFGTARVGASAVTDLDVDVTTPYAHPFAIEVDGGSASVSTESGGVSPTLLRPRLTAGVGLNMGPVKFNVPVMYYFDGGNTGLMAGLNVGIVW